MEGQLAYSASAHGGKALAPGEALLAGRPLLRKMMAFCPHRAARSRLETTELAAHGWSARLSGCCSDTGDGAGMVKEA